MIDTLGLPLDQARRLLTAQGYSVSDMEVRSRKGTEGGELRVVRVRKKDDGTVELGFSRFVTDIRA